MATTGSRSDPPRPAQDQRRRPSRNPAAQRRAMQAALAAAVLALRTPGDARNGGPPSPSGYV